MRLTIARLETAPILTKGAVAEEALGQSMDLMESVIEQIDLIGESYNGLLAYINQISGDQMAVDELNEKMKIGGFGLYGK